MNLKIPLLALFALTAFEIPRATALGNLAAQMQAGEWRELSTTNLLPTIRSEGGGASGTVLPYAQNGNWDPGTESFYFVGSDHQHATGYPKFITYSAQTNGWREMTRPSWFGALTASAMHGYDHNAIDTRKGILYFMDFCCPATCWKYVIKDSAWTKLPNPNLAYAYQTEGGLEYFPELGGLIFAENGAVYFFKDGATQWSTPLATGLTMGDYHNFAEYNPVHHVVVFGGGNGSNAMYKLDSLKKVTKLSDAPSEVGPLRVNQNIFTSDPVSGDFLVFGGAAGTRPLFYKYNVVTDVWTKLSQNTLSASTDPNAGAVYVTVATPVSTYGVTMFTSYLSGGHVYIYKHSPSTAAEKNTAPSQSLRIDASPNPVVSSAVIHVQGAAAGRVEISIYNLKGSLMERLAGDAGQTLAWNAEKHPAGVYVLRARVGSRNLSQKIVLRK